ncbi:MAG: ParA family protein [Oscillospiraceae bacterium]|nr:ParA family protein [Oscillospiraceae bacterium]
METIRISIFNNKGGVAKTTSVINLAYSLQKHDKSILVVDCDMQENCFDFFFSNKNADGIFETEFHGISHTTWQRYMKLLDTTLALFDIVIFDLPPALSDDVKQILKHSDYVFVPTILGEFEISGLKRVTDEINRQGTKLGGVYITMYQARNDAELVNDFRRVLRDRLMQTIIPYSITIRESQKAGLPIEAYFIERKVPKSSWKIVNAYTALADEILEVIA